MEYLMNTRIIVLGLSSLAAFGYYFYEVKQERIRKSNSLKRKKNKKQNSKKKVYQEMEPSEFTGVNNVSTFSTDALGMIIKCNKIFKDTFNGRIGVGYDWDAFLLDNFKREYKSQLKNHYRYKLDMKSDYFVYTNLNSQNGKRTGLIVKMNAANLSSLATERRKDMNHECVNVEELIERYITNTAANNLHKNFNLISSQYSEDVEMYVTHSIGLSVIYRYLNLLGIAQSTYFKQSKITLKTKRDEFGFHIIGEIGGNLLSHKKLKNEIQFNGELNSLIDKVKDIEDASKRYDVNFSIKNIMSNESVMTEFHLCVDDINKVVDIEKETVSRTYDIKGERLV